MVEVNWRVCVDSWGLKVVWGWSVWDVAVGWCCIGRLVWDVAARVRMEDSGTWWWFTGYYGYPDRGRRRESWDLLRANSFEANAISEILEEYVVAFGSK